ncbi:MAG TPA: hypothetical protein VLD19_10700, partial [Chitinophagaceae bacterium]|nr:hypothetical protein [Chitinophagaceae bacterium]
MSKLGTKYLVYTASALLVLMASGRTGQAQYYYKDVVLTAQIGAGYRLLRANSITAVRVTPSDAANAEKEGVTLQQTVYPAQNLLVTYTKTPESGASWVKAYYNENSRLLLSVDSTEDLVTRSQYAYDAAGRLSSISSNSVPKNDPAMKEVHQWTYDAAGKPVKMVKIKNDNDTT